MSTGVGKGHPVTPRTPVPPTPSRFDVNHQGVFLLPGTGPPSTVLGGNVGFPGIPVRSTPRPPPVYLPPYPHPSVTQTSTSAPYFFRHPSLPLSLSLHLLLS